MGKAIQRKNEFVLKRKGDNISESEDVVPPTNDTLSLLEVEQQQHNYTEQNHAEVPQANGPVTFQGTEFLQRDPGLRPQIWQYPPDQ
jgi:hypothetical protein